MEGEDPLINCNCHGILSPRDIQLVDLCCVVCRTRGKYCPLLGTRDDRENWLILAKDR